MTHDEIAKAVAAKFEDKLAKMESPEFARRALEAAILTALEMRAATGHLVREILPNFDAIEIWIRNKQFGFDLTKPAFERVDFGRGAREMYHFIKAQLTKILEGK